MVKYLLDVNMPNYFGAWKPPIFQHVVEIDPSEQKLSTTPNPQQHD